MILKIKSAYNIVFAKAGQDNVTSTKAKWQQWIGLDCYGKNK